MRYSSTSVRILELRGYWLLGSVNFYPRDAILAWVFATATCLSVCPSRAGIVSKRNKKAQLSLTNPRDAKACQKLLQFDVFTTLSLTILAYLHSFSCCCAEIFEIPRYSLKIQTYGVQGHPRSSILVSKESPCVTSY